MVRGPEIGVGVEQILDPAVVTLDMAPTLIDIAGLNPTNYGMDGISLWPILK